MNFLERFKTKKGYGYFVSLALTVLTLVLAIVYTTKYDLRASTALPIVLFVGFGIEVVMFGLTLEKYVPYVIGVVFLAGLCVFADSAVTDVVEVFVGIDQDHFSAMFITTLVLLLVGLVGAIADIFMPQLASQKTQAIEKQEVEVNE